MTPIVSFGTLLLLCFVLPVTWVALDKLSGKEVDWRSIVTALIGVLIAFFSWSKYT
jgi:hypothetical protein